MQRLNQPSCPWIIHPEHPYPHSEESLLPSSDGITSFRFPPHTSCRIIHIQHVVTTRLLAPPPIPGACLPRVYLLDHSHGPHDSPSSPWSQPLMTWPVPREKTKGWFWGRLLSSSVPSSSFPCETMGRPVRGGLL